jgi:hypothetical protein
VNTENTSHIQDIGLNYKITNFALAKNDINFLIGAGYSRQKFEEFDNIINLGQGFFGGNSYWFDKTTTIANGVYIKPQLQGRLGKKFEASLYGYTNFNGYKTIVGIGASINLFRIRVGNLN